MTLAALVTKRCRDRNLKQYILKFEIKPSKENRIMKKRKIAKWIAISVAVTAVIAFAAGVAYELRSIKKLTVDIDDDEEPQADDLVEEAAEA